MYQRAWDRTGWGTVHELHSTHAESTKIVDLRTPGSLRPGKIPRLNTAVQGGDLSQASRVPTAQTGSLRPLPRPGPGTSPTPLALWS